MIGHDILRSSMVTDAVMYERERQVEHRRMIREARAARPAGIGKVTWFGGIKATAQFLNDTAREALAQRRMIEARG